ncbi:MAG: thioredoxin domain-containing protein [Chthoniobacterales bacterium]
MKRYLPFVIIAAVAVLTVGAGALFYRAKQRPIASGGVTPPSTNEAGAEPLHVRGQPGAPVTLEEFGDFECPSCATAAEAISKLEQDYGPRLRVVWRNFPLEMHPHAREAALAAEAAGLQGHFWEMHDLLYKDQPVWSKALDVHPFFSMYARSLHLDVERFAKDSTSDEVKVRVVSNRDEGVSRGVKNTPTLFINHHELRPPFSPERMHEAIDAALAESTPKAFETDRASPPTKIQPRGDRK